MTKPHYVYGGVLREHVYSPVYVNRRNPLGRVMIGDTIPRVPYDRGTRLDRCTLLLVSRRGHVFYVNPVPLADRA